MPKMTKQEEHNSRLLIQASRTGDIEEVKRLVPLSDTADRNAALLRAALYGHIECVKLLLLSVSDSKKDNSAALRWAAKTGNTEILKLLLPYSDPKANNSWALKWATEHRHIDIVKLLIPVSDPKAGGSLALQSAAENLDMACMNLLIPHSDYHCALHILKEKNVNTTLLQQCVDEYEVLQQKTRLTQTIQGSFEKQNTYKRKI